ncbi:adenosine kinase [Dysgonomonas sp. 521]|uniref:adenosine kinase n=1 Tax=Dysgonomonas sp. 521 TaxID=2302932 RepID=UPI0013D44645|nr:adenosine kinase [Dysgonomonas sp. 521]NDV94142.1 adenosine kinase [Dysgonomonas sp. 521]
MGKVLGMGNALVDVLAIIEDDKMLELLELPKGSMQLIDEDKFKTLSKEFEKLNKSIVSGGSASNTIIGLTRLGIDAGFIGRIGKDSFGEYFKNDLKKYNVRSHLTEVNEVSGVASAFISKDGERTFGTFLGAAALLKAEELLKEDFRGYKYFYIEGYLVQSHALIRKAIELAKEAGAKVMLDLASYNVVEENREFLLEIIPQYASIVFANEEEAKALLDLDAEEAVSVLAKQVEIAIVKVGEKGSWIQQGDEKIFVPAYKVQCVDTTGAGDLYAAGFIYGLIHNCSLSVSGQIGTLLAAHVIQRLGAKVDDSKWDEIEAEIKDIKRK